MQTQILKNVAIFSCQAGTCDGILGASRTRVLLQLRFSSAVGRVGIARHETVLEHGRLSREDFNNLLLRLKVAGLADVINGYLSLCQRHSHKLAPVTVLRIQLGAKQADIEPFIPGVIKTPNPLLVRIEGFELFVINSSAGIACLV